MSEELQKEHDIFKGDTVLYRDGGGHLAPRIVHDVEVVTIRVDESYVAVILEDDLGYVDFSDVITIGQVVDMLGLELKRVTDDTKSKSIPKVFGVLFHKK